MDKERTEKIRKLNDAFRKKGIGGKVVLTHGVFELGGVMLHKVRKALVLYDDFSEDNDPYGEHDFGSVTIEGHKLFWKIDYYVSDMCHGSEDPSDPKVTKRVMTIMLASEY